MLRFVARPGQQYRTYPLQEFDSLGAVPVLDAVPVAGRFGVAWVVEEAGQPGAYGVALLDSSVRVLGSSCPEPVVVGRSLAG